MKWGPLTLYLHMRSMARAKMLANYMSNHFKLIPSAASANLPNYSDDLLQWPSKQHSFKPFMRVLSKSIYL